MIRPLYRWKSFWLGVAVLGFMCWVWTRSMSLHDHFTFAGARHTIMGEQVLGELRVEVVRAGLSDWGESLDTQSWGSYPAKGESIFGETPAGFSKWFPPYATPFDTDFGGDYQGRGMIIAHWFLFLLFLLPWTAFLAWRWRRMRRLSVAQVEVSHPTIGG